MPVTPTYPGVYLEELPSGVHTITGVATSIAAFVGWAPQGSTSQAVLVQSYLDFEREYGGLDARSLLGYSVAQFFNNGGQQAYIVRLATSSVLTSTTTSTATSAAISITSTPGSLSFTAKNPGAAYNSYGILIQASSNNNTTDYKASVVYAPSGSSLVVIESQDNIAGGTAPTFATVTVGSTGSPTAAPAAGLFMLAGGSDGNGIGVPAANPASLTIYTQDSTTANPLGFTFTAANPGAWGNLLAIGVTPQPGDSTKTRFSLNVVTITAKGTLAVLESFNNLCVLASDPRYVVSVLTASSNYVAIQAIGSPAQAPNQPYPPSTAGTAPYSTSPQAFLSGGLDGLVLDPTQDSSSGGLFMTALNADGSTSGGVHLLDTVPIFNLLCVPGESDPTTISDLQAYCVGKYAFMIVDCKQSDSFSSLQNGPTGLSGTNADHSAFYFPWVNAPDPLQQNRLSVFPPSGFVAGLYAATDASRGVWKAPAGIDAGLTGDGGLSVLLTDLQHGTLNILGINCLRNFQTYGDVIWGARTLAGSDQAGSDWKYVPIRRLALYIEASLIEGTQWVVFEPNDETLWGQVRMNIGTFLQGLFLQGAFAGTTPQQAYFVKCDAENNPDSSVAQGIINIMVGFAPLYPAEFVIIQIQQISSQSGS